MEFESVKRFKTQAVYSQSSEEMRRQEVGKVHHLILAEGAGRGVADFDMVGPLRAFSFAARGRHNWQFLSRTLDSGQMRPGCLRREAEV